MGGRVLQVLPKLCLAQPFGPCKISPMKDVRIPLFCAILTGAGLALSNHFGAMWSLAWVAPVPVLALAFGRVNPVVVLTAALAAGVLAGLALVAPYLEVVPGPTLAGAIALNGIGFAVCVMLARFAGRTAFPIAAPLVFAALWTVWDFVAASGPDGALASPAYGQAGIPILIQAVPLFGAWVVTFLIGAMAGLVALAFARRNSLYLLPAAALITANLVYGTMALKAPQGPERRVMLIDSDALAEASTIDSRNIALGAVLAYAAEIRLKAKGADLVVLPERIAILRTGWRDEALDYLQAVSSTTGAEIVAGFELRGQAGARNIAYTIKPDGSAPTAYVQTSMQGGTTKNVAVAISHDVNFFDAMRMRMASLHTGLVAIPAWDFGSDGGAEARKAVMRGLESGFAVARAARNGRLTLSDAQGRILAMTSTGPDGFTVLSRHVAIGPDPGDTLYDRIGDVFVWVSAFLGGGLIFFGLLRVLANAAPMRDLRARYAGRLPVAAWTLAPLTARHAAAPRRRR